ncbi:flagellar biosynthesis protein FlgD [Burkholderia pseudomallei]|nr:flagellar biosynthesis protein FlgD [Burkholderia pseudomallei]OMS83631.1 flagellar biosynthesis protein FlgD [Burkholderia pseudomallei]OMU97319.1 flagellar biosynthesis protein FlgD [Burkholderia pseudomallei]OMV03085.1 flagellar biosynthesis protein FlgD [Burkholderia pseudomallei]OMW62693.1 flagellar biosynthesis protein FlgD [Burkholderia pseudomallei]
MTARDRYEDNMSNTIQPRAGDMQQPGAGQHTPSPYANGANSPTDLFAKLLAAQIQNQNPLEPMDASQFVTQIMMGQQTEALGVVANLTQNSAALMESMLVVSLGSQVGTQVMVRTDSLELKDDRRDARIVLDNAESDVTVVLTDSAGNSHRIALGAQAKGDVNFTIDPEELGLPAGQYKIRVETASGAKAGVEIEGTLENVRLAADGKVILHVAGVGDVETSSISSFLGRRPANETRKETV